MHHHLVLALLECLIGEGVDGIFDVYTHPCILQIVRVGEESGELTFGVILLQFFDITVRHLSLLLSGIKQIQMVIGFVEMLEIRVVVHQPEQHLLAQCQVVEPVLEDDSGMV